MNRRWGGGSKMGPSVLFCNAHMHRGGGHKWNELSFCVDILEGEVMEEFFLFTMTKTAPPMRGLEALFLFIQKAGVHSASARNGFFSSYRIFLEKVKQSHRFSISM